MTLWRGGAKKNPVGLSPGVLKERISRDLDNLSRVEVLPVLEVIEVHCVKDGSVISDADSCEDSSASRVIVIVAHNSSVVCVDLAGIKRSTALVKDPLLALSVGRLVCLDVVEEGFTVDAKRVEGHLVEASTCSRVVGMEFSSSIQRSFLPETWKVKNSERSGDTGGDSRNDLAHFSSFVIGFCIQRPRRLATYKEC